MYSEAITAFGEFASDDIGLREEKASQVFRANEGGQDVPDLNSDAETKDDCK